MTIAILSAMHEENASIINTMEIERVEKTGSRIYHIGTLYGAEVIAVFSHWGKVAAAITTTSLISRYDVDEIIFTGVAGGIADFVSVGDIVVGANLYQHDMDVRPIIRQHEIPLLGRAEIATSETIRIRLSEAAKKFLEIEFSDIPEASKYNRSPSVFIDDIASGDQFVSDPELARDIRTRLPTVACVEMEGAAVAQVAESYNIPFGIVRTISDSANEESQVDFTAFISDIAQAYSLGIIKYYLR